MTDTPTPLPEASGRDLVTSLFGHLRRYRVRGDSMLPTLETGQIVLVDSRRGAKELDIVCARHPAEDVHIIKRVSFIDDDRYFLISDNPTADGAVDSQTFGAVERSALLGVVVSVVR